MYTCLCAKCTCILLINKCSAIHNGAPGYAEHLFNSIWWPPNQSPHQIHNLPWVSWSLESSMNRKKKKQKIEKKHILENFQFQHISIFWEYIDDVFSFDAFSENKIYSWRERTLLNCLYTVNTCMHVYVLYFNLENTCK